MPPRAKKRPKFVIGWREWVSLPELNVPAIRAKVDTGTRTSVIHAEKIEVSHVAGGKTHIRFNVHLEGFKAGRKSITVTCESHAVDRRTVTDSQGHAEKRWVVRTLVKLGKHQWPIEVALSNRRDMQFRMLLGRKALEHRCLIHPDRSFLTGRELVKKARRKSDQPRKPAGR